MMRTFLILVVATLMSGCSSPMVPSGYTVAYEDVDGTVKYRPLMVPRPHNDDTDIAKSLCPQWGC